MSCGRWIVRLLAGGLVAGSVSAMDVENPDVPDVRAAFGRIAVRGTPFGISNAGVIPFPAFSYNPYHNFRADHFQGVQRLRAGPFFVVTGSALGKHGPLPSPPPADAARWVDSKGLRGYLFVAHLASRLSTGAWVTNLDAATGHPGSEDKLVAAVEIELTSPGGTGLWHPGGFSVVGDLLVVPVENYLAPVGEIASQILFYDMSDPVRPRQLPERILRDREPLKAKAGAASLVRLRDGTFLLACQDTTHLFFYFSRSPDFARGFEPLPRFVMGLGDGTAAPGVEPRGFGGQSFQFVRQSGGEIFAVAFRTYTIDETVRHVASLWQMTFADEVRSQPPQLVRIAEKICGVDLLGPRGWGDFEAAPGLFVTERGELAIYVAGRWLAREVIGDFQAARSPGDYVSPDDALFLPAVEFWSGTAVAP